MSVTLPANSSAAHINKRRLLIILLLGFSSGLPLALTGTMLQAWFTVSGISIVTIGVLSLVGQPYVYKFLWAPLLDRYIPPLLGRRRGWLMITQAALLISIAAMALGSPLHHPMALAALALLIAFLSASQDIASDAYRTDVTAAQERGLSAALYTGGYRVAMMVSGGLGLVLADVIGWSATYLVMASLMLIGLMASWYSAEPDFNGQSAHPTNLYGAVVEPWREFFARKQAWIFLLVILFYKLGDALSISLTTPFLLRGLGFSLTVVGSVNKSIGLVATLLGIFVAGAIMTRLSLYRSLLLFGILQMVAILLFMQLAVIGKNYSLLIVTVFIDNLFNGMGTAAFLAFLMSLCDHRYTATQYALFSALASIGRVFVGPLAGVMVEHIGWVHFFAWSFVVSLPGIILLRWVRGTIETRTGYPKEETYYVHSKS